MIYLGIVVDFLPHLMDRSAIKRIIPKRDLIWVPLGIFFRFIHKGSGKKAPWGLYRGSTRGFIGAGKKKIG